MAEGSERALVLAVNVKNEAVSGAAAQTAAELRVAGFEVLEEASEDLAGPRLSQRADETGSVAAVKIEQGRGILLAEVWVWNPSDSRADLYRLRVEGASLEDARVLALRVLDAVYASSPKLRMLSSSEPAPSVLPPDSPGETGETGQGLQVSLSAGAAALGAVTGIPVAFGPAFSVAVRFAPPWSADITLVGPTFTSVRAETGEARVDQELLWARLRLEPFAPTGALIPFIFAGAGGYRLAAAGRAISPYDGERASGVSAALGAGAGGRLRLSEIFSLLADGSVLFVAPRPVLLFADAEPARVARPTLAAAVSLEVAL